MPEVPPPERPAQPNEPAEAPPTPPQAAASGGQGATPPAAQGWPQREPTSDKPNVPSDAQPQAHPAGAPLTALLPEGTLPTAVPSDEWLRQALKAPAAESRNIGDPAALQPPRASTRFETAVATPIDGFQAVATAPPMERRAGRSFARGLREVVETIVLALLIFLLVRAVVQNFQVDGSSMAPTLRHNWFLLVNKALYWEINLDTVHKFLPFVDPGDDPTRYVFRSPERGDVIVFKAPRQDRDFIKRIIAEPGEVIQVAGGIVYIDGLALDEPYISDRPNADFGPVRVPPDCYFVLGDNRNNSSDSRSWGAVPKDNIIGQAWLNYWPFSIFGLADNTSVEPMANLPQGPPKELITGPALSTTRPAVCNA